MSDYPDEAEMAALETMPAFTRADCLKVLEAAESIWIRVGTVTRLCDEFRFITGGWSGNEDILDALGKNFVFWSQCWKSSHRGGKFVFELPEE